jgi:hypothetical protein
MLVPHLARAHGRRTALTLSAVLLLMPARRSAAQFDAPLRVRGAESSAAERPLNAAGDLSLCRAFRCEQAASLALEVAPSARWRISAEGSAGRSLLVPSSPLHGDRRVDLFYGGSTAQVWLGRGAADSRGDDSLASSPTRWLEYGAVMRWRSTSVSVSVGSGSAPTAGAQRSSTRMRVFHTLDSLTGVWYADSVPETMRSDGGTTRWRSAELRLAWRSDQWRLGTALGRVTTQSGGRAVWSSTEVRRRLGSAVTALASVGTYPRSFTMQGPRARWTFMAGLSAATSLLSREPRDRFDPDLVAERFSVVNTGPMRYRVVVRLPDVSRVELASDFTEWRPIDMQRVSDDLWAVEVPATPGAHHVSLRADGGSWFAPPGLASESDDFGGNAGVVVIR